MRKALFTLFLAVSTLLSYSQTGKWISGTVKNMQNIPVPDATIKLLKADDSSVVKAGASNGNGRFRFEQLANGNYLLSVTVVSYKPFTSSVTITDQHNSIVLPAVILMPAQSRELKEVVVTAKRPLLEHDIDKTIVNVDAMISSASSNTLEVLEKTPGVMVGNNGDISLNGKNNVLVLIDGRSTYMSGQDLAAYLKSLPGGLLDKIELIDNPSARYDAAGGAVINIKLKKNRASGFTGNISSGYSQGIRARSYQSLNLNYNLRKANWFTNIGYNTDGYRSKDFSDRKYYTADKELDAQALINNKSISTSRGLNARLGLDYTLSPKAIIGSQIFFQNRPREEIGRFETNSYNESFVLDSVNRGNMDGDFDWTTAGVNLNFLHKLNNAGRELSADLNYIRYNSDGLQRFSNLAYASSGTLDNEEIFNYDLKSGIDIYNLKADYVHPLKNRASFEAGIKASVVENDIDSRYLASTGVQDDSRSNHFIFRENVNAGYANLRRNWARLGLQLGARVENTQLEGDLLPNSVVTKNSFKQNFTNFFPSAYITYKLDSAGKHNLTASFGRRVNRPGYQQFNPFLVYRDNYSYSAGNPELQPGYGTNYELRYQYRQLLNVSVSYREMSNIIFNATETVDNIFISRPANAGKGSIVILSINLTTNLYKWWFLNVNLQAAHLQASGGAYDQRIDASLNSARINVINQFTFPKGWGGELTFYYAARDYNPQYYIQARYRSAASMQKKIWKEKGSIRLSIEDILFSWKQEDNSIGIKQASVYHINRSDTRRVGLAFTYRFGKETFARKRRHTDNAADAEKGRVE